MNGLAESHVGNPDLVNNAPFVLNHFINLSLAFSERILLTDWWHFVSSPLKSAAQTCRTNTNQMISSFKDAKLSRHLELVQFPSAPAF